MNIPPPKRQTRDLTDKELRMWVAEQTLAFHKNDADTKRLQSDMIMILNFINDNGKQIPDKITYV